MLSYFKMTPFPLPCQERLRIFLWYPLWGPDPPPKVKFTKAWGSWWSFCLYGLPQFVNYHCFLLTLTLVPTEVCAYGFLLRKLWFSVFVCWALQSGGRGLLWPQFSERPKTYWFFSLFIFAFVYRTQWQLPAVYMPDWKPEVQHYELSFGFHRFIVSIHTIDFCTPILYLTTLLNSCSTSCFFVFVDGCPGILYIMMTSANRDSFISFSPICMTFTFLALLQ